MVSAAEEELDLAISAAVGMIGELKATMPDGSEPTLDDLLHNERVHYEKWKTIGDKYKETLLTAPTRTSQQNELIKEWDVVSSKLTAKAMTSQSDEEPTLPEQAEQSRRLARAQVQAESGDGSAA